MLWVPFASSSLTVAPALPDPEGSQRPPLERFLEEETAVVEEAS